MKKTWINSSQKVVDIEMNNMRACIWSQYETTKNWRLDFTLICSKSNLVDWILTFFARSTSAWERSFTSLFLIKQMRESHAIPKTFKSVVFEKISSKCTNTDLSTSWIHKLLKNENKIKKIKKIRYLIYSDSFLTMILIYSKIFFFFLKIGYSRPYLIIFENAFSSIFTPNFE